MNSSSSSPCKLLGLYIKKCKACQGSKECKRCGGGGDLLREGYGVSVSSCDLHALMAMNRATPKYQATGVSSGQEAPKTASLSPTVLRVQH